MTLKQTYENTTNDPIEATFQFQLEDDAAVSGFYAEIDGKRVKGICQEKEKAKDTYDNAISSGHGAYLVEQTSSNNFTMSVGNLPPGKKVVAELTYIKELYIEDSQVNHKLHSFNDLKHFFLKKKQDCFQNS